MVEQRDQLLEKMQLIVGETPILSDLLTLGLSKSRAATSHACYNTTSVLSSLDVGEKEEEEDEEEEEESIQCTDLLTRRSTVEPDKVCELPIAAQATASAVPSDLHG